MYKDKLPQCRIYKVLDAQERVSDNAIHCRMHNRFSTTVGAKMREPLP